MEQFMLDIGLKTIRDELNIILTLGFASLFESVCFASACCCERSLTTMRQLVPNQTHHVPVNGETSNVLKGIESASVHK